MLERALTDGVLFAWVVADSGYGRDADLRAFLHRERLSYVLAVPISLPVTGPPGKPAPGTKKIKRADHLLSYAKRRDQWERRSCGEGSKGLRYYDWTRFEVKVTGQEPADGYEHHLLIRRSTHKKKLAGGRYDYAAAGPVTEEASSPRPPTAFQTFLDQRDIPRPKSWRTLGS